jgi:PPP family 3-phenylpropionic acid transporter
VREEGVIVPTSYRPDTTKHALMGFYAACVGAIAGLPFLAPILVDAGVSKSQVALLFLTFPVCKLLVSPAIGSLSDRVGRTTHLLALSALLAFLGVLLIMVSPVFSLLIVGLVLLALGETSLFPLGDALTLQLLGKESREYGRIRAVGSATLICLVLLVGWLSQTEGRLLLLPSVVGFAVTAGVSLRLPTPQVRATPQAHTKRSIRQVLRAPGIPLLVVIAILHGMTFTTYDKLFTLHVVGQGHDLWLGSAGFATGIAAETIILWFGRPILHRWGLERTLTVGVAVGVLRWTVTGWTHDPTLLVITQALHGGSFGLYWIAGVALFTERAPGHLGSTAQAVFQGATLGAGQLLAMAGAAVLLPIGDTPLVFYALAGVSAGTTLLCWVGLPDPSTKEPTYPN